MEGHCRRRGGLRSPTKIREATLPERTSISCVQWDIGIKRVVRTRGTIFFTLAFPNRPLSFTGLYLSWCCGFSNYLPVSADSLIRRMKSFHFFISDIVICVAYNVLFFFRLILLCFYRSFCKLASSAVATVIRVHTVVLTFLTRQA